MKENFSFHLEIKVLNSEGKTDAQRLLQVQCDVFSQMINWECVMASTVFYIVQSESGRLHSVCLFFFFFFLDYFMLPFANKLYGNVYFLFQQDLA